MGQPAAMFSVEVSQELRELRKYVSLCTVQAHFFSFGNSRKEKECMLELCN
jgi:hypothetical protein